jgi:IS30 family transposase
LHGARRPPLADRQSEHERLLRQCLAKSADLRAWDQADLDAIAAELNARPRRILVWAPHPAAENRVFSTGSGPIQTGS